MLITLNVMLLGVPIHTLVRLDRFHKLICLLSPVVHDTELAAGSIDCWPQRTGALSGSSGCSPSCMMNACVSNKIRCDAMGHAASQPARTPVEG